MGGVSAALTEHLQYVEDSFCDSLCEMQLLYVEYMLFSIDPSDIYVDIGSLKSAVLLQ